MILEWLDWVIDTPAFWAGVGLGLSALWQR